ncbi:unnamed protein product [Phyllotreta striolata]|uniref:Uncharacterized protein n=1 Tax=Phyllotreta striolata TaxID=444603 RepID=A0A9N9TS61_PHYSR|nr:unnamed protein product [Phyllotreta striolata]
MPGLPETIYSSEQISIPPAFPYLLRQYAKAAIRSQPTDLLQWSTAYFRCLSLNLLPPVKPRLEYPIPREYFGITPGWLKALLHQISYIKTIHFKTLWDRWTGACLSHNTLIQMLCLGGFTDHKTIPWPRFVGLCAAHLTDDLTSTMKLICEILTEEPEGGSAMIPYETFMDLYEFLAKIDASKPQLLKNIYFGDAILNVYKRLSEKDLAIEKTSEVEEEEESVKKSESISYIDVDYEKELSEEDISCPSMVDDDHYSVDYYYDQVLDLTQMEEEGEGGIPAYLKHAMMQETEEGEVEEMGVESYMYDGEDEGEGLGEEVTIIDERKSEAKSTAEYKSEDTITGEPTRKMVARHVVEDEKTLEEDLERLKALQQELPGEMDEELEKYKCRLLEEMPLTGSQQIAIEEFKDKEEEVVEKAEEEVAEEKSEQEVPGVTTAKDKSAENIEVWVDKVPGIGGVVPDHLIKAVSEYMKGLAAVQHNMVMPRNIRHYNCPPLEVVESN